jgi:hypothetical protein
MKKTLILVTAAGLACGFFALDLHQYLTLDGIKAGLARFEAQRAASPLAIALAYFCVYVVATALSIQSGSVFVPRQSSL